MPGEVSRVLVTGATGFVGTHFCRHLLANGYHVKALGRQDDIKIDHPSLEYYKINMLDDNIDWQPICNKVDVIVHLAARVHHLKDQGMQALALYQEANVKITQQLAKAAIKNEIKRFIYLSTIKVHAEKTIDMPLRAEDHPRPKGAYSLSKLQAERILQEESRRSGMEWVIIRPPLVYGSKVGGNFRQLLQMSNSCFPLPFGTIRNRRSLVSVYNLCSFIERCLWHPNARNEVFLVSDNQDLSTPQLIRILRHQLGKKSYLFPFPLFLLKLLGCITRKKHQIDRMVDSLQVNIEKSSRLLDWQPPLTVEASLETLCKEELNLV